MEITKYSNICDKYKKQLEKECIISEKRIISDSNNVFPRDKIQIKQSECDLLHILYSNCLIFQKKKKE